MKSDGTTRSRRATTPVRSNSAEAILANATRLFASKGFEQTTIRDICYAAGVTRPTLYYFYQNKIGLFRAVMDRARRHFAEYALKAAHRHLDFREHCLHLTRLLFEDAVENPQMWRLMLASIWQDTAPVCDEVTELRESMLRVLIPEDIELSSKNSNPQLRAAAHVYAGAVSFMIARYLNTGEPEISTFAAESVGTVMCDGYASIAGERGFRCNSNE